MNRYVALIPLAVVCALRTDAGIGVGDNIILNGRFEADQVALPPYWEGLGNGVDYRPDGGPDGLPAICFTPKIGESRAVSQRGLETASNGLYRVSFMYRAENADFETLWVGIYAAKWDVDDKFVLQGCSPGWQRVDRTVRAPFHASANTHTFFIYVKGLKTGAVEIANVSVSPADGETASCTRESSLVSARKVPRLVPLAPRLDEISRTKRTIGFRFFGEVPEGVEEGSCSFSFDFGAAGRTEVPFTRDDVRVKLPADANGGDFTAAVSAKGRAEPIFRRTFGYALAAECRYPSEGRRLNNLCTELLCKRYAPGRHRFEFSCRHRAWHFLSVPGSARIDGRPALDGTHPRHEAFRELAPGDHVLELDLEQEGEVVVRRISEILNYCVGVNPPIRECGTYDWDFTLRHVLPGMTTMNQSRLPQKDTAQLREWGYCHLVNQKTTDLTSDDEVLKRLAAGWGFRPGGGNDGVTADEQYIYKSEIMNRFAAGLWRFRDPHGLGRRIYSWFVGNPSVGGVDHDVLSAAVNATGGKGKALFEMYSMTRATEGEARDYIRSRMRETIAKYRGFCPGIDPRFGLVFGNFNLTGRISVWHHPGVDMKRFLDLQWNILATDPEFAGLGTCGYWGSHDTDEEIHRWCFLLTRHYVVEGRRDLLSDRYGFAYNGLLKNGDFENGLVGWTPSAGVTAGRIPGLATKVECRWHAPQDLGDTCAIFPEKRNGVESSVSQTVSGLREGCLYRIFFCSVNVDDVNANRMSKYDHGVHADLGSGATRVEGLSWLSFDNDARGKKDAARCNIHSIVFRAKTTSTCITIANGGARSGDKIAVNFISVNPYLAAEHPDSDSCRRDIRAGIADPARFEDAVASGLKSPDALVRRFVLNALLEKDPVRGLAAARTMFGDPSEEVQLFLLDVSGLIADPSDRSAFIASVVSHSKFPEVVNAADRRGGFEFHRVNLPLSQDPENDHELQLVERIDLPLDGWAFNRDLRRSAHRGGSPFFRPILNDAGWKRLSIGKNWESQGFDGFDGIGWYRRAFLMPTRPAEAKTVELCFDAVDEEAWVWLNGKYVGQHAEGVSGWNKPFRFRVDDEIVWGGENQITVRVNDSGDAGGIWKGIRLEVLK